MSTAASLAVLLAACSNDSPLAPRSQEPQRPNVAFAQSGAPTTETIVMLKKYASMDETRAAIIAAGGTVTREFPQIGILMTTGINGVALWNIKLAGGQINNFVVDRELQWIPSPVQLGMTEAAAATDPTTSGTNQSTAAFFNSFQWNMKQIQAPAAWNASPTGAGRTVCVLDTGIDPGHLDMIGKVDLTKVTSVSTDVSFAGNQTPNDYNFHGTFVASQIVSRGVGMASVAPDAKICAVKVLNQNGSGSFNDVIAGIVWAADNGADVINMSLGAYFDTRGTAYLLVQAIQTAIDYANSKGVVVVASSGNNGVNLDTDYSDVLSIPAQLKGVISVGATGPVGRANYDNLASYSAYGGVTGIALVAPGGSGTPVFQNDLVIGACSRFALTFNCAAGNNYLVGNGTSFASPLVAGAAAVVKSYFPFRLTPSTVRRCLTTSADVVGPSAIFGAGRLNVFRALSCAA